MGARDELHQLLDDLTDDEAAEALEYLHWLVDTRDQPTATEACTIDDAGDVLPTAAVYRRLGLWDIHAPEGRICTAAPRTRPAVLQPVCVTSAC